MSTTKKKTTEIKYITHSNPNVTRRLMFKVLAPGSKTCVIVEDIISAIVVNKATGFNTIAILTNNIGDDIIEHVKQYDRVIVWLDYDVRTLAIKQTSRLRSLGLNVECKVTKEDPKRYEPAEIRDHLTKQRILN